MFITYTSRNEILVCTPETESTLLKEYFEKDGRNKNYYDRKVHCDPVQIKTSLDIKGWRAEHRIF